MGPFETLKTLFSTSSGVADQNVKVEVAKTLGIGDDELILDGTIIVDGKATK